MRITNEAKATKQRQTFGIDRRRLRRVFQNKLEQHGRASRNGRDDVKARSFRLAAAGVAPPNPLLTHNPNSIHRPPSKPNTMGRSSQLLLPGCIVLAATCSTSSTAFLAPPAPTHPSRVVLHATTSSEPPPRAGGGGLSRSQLLQRQAVASTLLLGGAAALLLGSSRAAEAAVPTMQVSICCDAGGAWDRIDWLDLWGSEPDWIEMNWSVMADG